MTLPLKFQMDARRNRWSSALLMFPVRFCNIEHDDKQSHVLTDCFQRGRGQGNFRILSLDNIKTQLRTFRLRHDFLQQRSRHIKVCHPLKIFSLLSCDLLCWNMPFLGQDWRSPGQSWVKTEDGWKRTTKDDNEKNNNVPKRSVSYCWHLCRFLLIWLTVLCYDAHLLTLSEEIAERWKLSFPDWDHFHWRTLFTARTMSNRIGIANGEKRNRTSVQAWFHVAFVFDPLLIILLLIHTSVIRWENTESVWPALLFPSLWLYQKLFFLLL